MRLLTVLFFVPVCGCGLEVQPSLAPPRRAAAASDTPPQTSVSAPATAERAASTAGSSSDDRLTTPVAADSAARDADTRQHDSNPDDSLPTKRDASGAGQTSLPSDNGGPIDTRLPPRLVAAQTEYDFGIMDPHQTGTHVFAVRNEGTGPLRFLDHRSDCKCTVGRFPNDPIPPGGEAEVEIHWKTQANNERFEHSATVETNDPETPQLTFTVRGNVLVHAGATPPQFTFSSVRPGVAAESTSIISSQVWESFQIRDISSSLEGIRWTVEPASAEELQRQRARSGHRLTVHLPEDLPQGSFTHEIRFHLQPGEESAGEGKEYRLPVTGKVLRRLAVYGPGIDHGGNVAMGVIQTSRGHTHRLIVKVYDQDQEIDLSDVAVSPEFLQVRLIPYEAQGEAKGLYHLEIEVPPATLPGRYIGTRAATVQLKFDHPRISELLLRPQFTIAGPTADAR